jgi:hypothetical protein
MLMDKATGEGKYDPRLAETDWTLARHMEQATGLAVTDLEADELPVPDLTSPAAFLPVKGEYSRFADAWGKRLVEAVTPVFQDKEAFLGTNAPVNLWAGLQYLGLLLIESARARHAAEGARGTDAVALFRHVDGLIDRAGQGFIASVGTQYRIPALAAAAGGAVHLTVSGERREIVLEANRFASGTLAQSLN